MQVYAAEYYGNFQYEDNGENVSIYAYNGSDKEVTIPAYINGKEVTEINDYAFLLCNSVEKIIVPSTVTTIHTNAFSGAGNLKNVVLASSDTEIEDSNEDTDKKDTDENGNLNPSDATDNKNGDNSENKDAGNANPPDVTDIRIAIIQKIKMPESLIRPTHQIVRLRNSPKPTMIRAIIKLR